MLLAGARPFPFDASPISSISTELVDAAASVKLAFNGFFVLPPFGLLFSGLIGFVAR